MKLTTKWHCVAALIIAASHETFPSAHDIDPNFLHSTENGLTASGITGSSHIFRENARGLASGNIFQRMNRVDPTQLHDVIFAIQQKNIETLTGILHDISDPESPNYGKYMTRADIAELTGNPNARDEVLSYVMDAGAKIVSETSFGDYITASAPVSVWEKMFDTEFFTYSMSTTSGDENKYIRAEKYSLPSILHTHVESVFNTIQMPSDQALSARNPSRILPLMIDPNAGTNPVIQFPTIHLPNVVSTLLLSPSLIIKEYNIDSNVSHPLATQAVLGVPTQFFSPMDLYRFQDSNSLPRRNITASYGGHIATKLECNINRDVCGLSNMDIQLMMSISGSPTIYYRTDLGLSAWLQEVSSVENPPLVISISYGFEEADVTVSEFDAFNIEAMKLSLMGTTLLAAAGDDGANSWKVRGNKNFCGYSPQFPASSPYVLSVGATQVIFKAHYDQILNVCDVDF